MPELTLSSSLRRPRAFLALATAVWLPAYLGLAPMTRSLVDAVGLDRATHLGGAIEFFLYDTPKVLLLLIAVVFAMGMVNSYFTPERTRALLAGRSEAAAAGATRHWR